MPEKKITGSIEELRNDLAYAYGGPTIVDGTTLTIIVRGKAAGALDVTRPITITQEGNE